MGISKGTAGFLQLIALGSRMGAFEQAWALLKGQYFHPSVGGYIDDRSGEGDVSRNEEPVPEEGLPPMAPQQPPQKGPFDIKDPAPGILPEDFWSDHFHERVTDRNRTANEKEEEEVKARVTEAILPFLDAMGNYRPGAPKNIAVRSHILGEHRSHSPASEGDSIVSIIRPHKMTGKPELNTVMLRNSELSNTPQPFRPEAMRVDKVINNHNYSNNEYKRMLQRAGRMGVNRKRGFAKSENLLKDSKIGVSGHAPTNDPRFWEVMQHYGTQDPSQVGVPFLPYNPELATMGPQVDELLANYGYEPYYFSGPGGRFPLPDLQNKNYETGHLAIFDPGVKSASFGDVDFTDNWRKIHELGHGLGLQDLNAKWGEGRRLGKVGVRSPREMLRAIDWETMALNNQRNLMREIGLDMDPKQFNRDWNTTIGDAGFRALTGKFTSPTEEGFVPHDEKISPKHSIRAIEQRAEELGLGMDDNLRSIRGRKVASEPMDLAFRLLKRQQS